MNLSHLSLSFSCHLYLLSTRRSSLYLPTVRSSCRAPHRSVAGRGGRHLPVSVALAIVNYRASGPAGQRGHVANDYRLSSQKRSANCPRRDATTRGTVTSMGRNDDVVADSSDVTAIPVTSCHQWLRCDSHQQQEQRCTARSVLGFNRDRRRSANV